jgi:cobalt-precorrin 5A hydrolase
MNLALITLSREGAEVCRRLAAALPGASLFVHSTVVDAEGAETFERVLDLTKAVWKRFEGLVYVAPCGVVVRALAGSLRHKLYDPAVVVVDVGGRYAISLVGGHEAGANALAVQIANVLGAEPVISTSSEAVKTLIVGVGCRRGVTEQEVVRAVRGALESVGAKQEDVRLLASADIKAEEAGLLQAARSLAAPLRFVPSDEIRSSVRAFGRSKFVQERVDLPAVAEPAALLAGRRTRLVLRKTTFGRVTVAIARESCSWSGSDPADGSTGPTAPNRR